MEKKTFKKLTEEDIEKIKTSYYNRSKINTSVEKVAIMLGNEFNLSERTIRKWFTKLGFKEKTDIEPEQYEEAKKRTLNTEKKRFLVSWAQNNTPLHRKLFNHMKLYAEKIDADIHIIAGRYKNPTSVHVDQKFDFWDTELSPYLDANRHNLHKYLSILSDVKIQPTAANPLSGMASMSGMDSCIFGHPKVQMEIIPVLEGYKPKAMWTTGACTLKNYTDSKAGKKGEFHHTLGFVVIEIEDEEIFHVRQVTANNNGDFNDLFYSVKDGVIQRINSIEAIVLGDIHLGDMNEEIMNLTTGLLDDLKPKYTVLHDLFNGHSISHHDLKNPIKLYQKEKEGKNSLKNEIDEMLEWLERMRKYNLVVVRSNHDDFVDRWIINSDWKKDIKNSMEYMEYTRILLANEAPKGIIPYIIDKNFPDIRTLNRDESFRVKGWELANHGDIGSNGAKGTSTGFRNLNTKIITGHTHTPTRRDGALSVGTSTNLRLEYNQGASSWLNSHIIIFPSGKAQHINFIKGKDGKYSFTTL